MDDRRPLDGQPALDLPPAAVSALSNLGGDREIFPSLQCASFDQMVVDNYDWSPLTTFLARPASSGNQREALETSTSLHMCEDVADGIRSTVQAFSD